MGNRHRGVVGGRVVGPCAFLRLPSAERLPTMRGDAAAPRACAMIRRVRARQELGQRAEYSNPSHTNAPTIIGETGVIIS